MVALNLSRNFSDSSIREDAPVFQRIPLNLSSTHVFARATSFSPDAAGMAQGLMADDLEPVEQRVERNIFKMGILDEATKRALIADSSSVGRFLSGLHRTKREEHEAQKDEIFRQALAVALALHPAGIPLDTIHVEQYLTVATFLGGYNSRLIDLIFKKEAELEELDEQITGLSEDVANQRILVKDTETEVYSALEDRQAARRLVDDVEREHEDALRELDQYMSERDRARHRLYQTERNVARDWNGRATYRDNNGRLYGIDENGERIQYNPVYSGAVKIKMFVLRQNNTADQADKCRHDLETAESRIDDTLQDIDCITGRQHAANTHYVAMEARYQNLQTFLNELRQDLYEKEEALNEAEIAKRELIQQIDILQSQKQELNMYISRFTDSDTIRALNNGDITMQELIDDIPAFAKQDYEDSLVSETTQGSKSGACKIDMETPNSPYKKHQPIIT